MFAPNESLFAQQGKVDITFNTKDDGQNGDGFNAAVRTLLLQKDGSLIVGGDYLSLNGFPVSYITRLNPDGSIDDSFNTGTGFNGKVYASYLQEDGKIILGGSFTSYNGVSAGRLIRLNPDGSYDESFNTTIGATTGIIYDIDLQSDGKIIIVGSFTKYTNATVNRVARLLPNGALDSSFLTGSGSALNITHVRVISGQKVILTGNFTTFNNTSANRIIRLKDDGSFDSDFNCGTGFNDDINAIALRPDGKIVLGGNFTMYDDVTANRIICLNEDGSRDDSFQTGTGFSKEGVQVLKINANGDIMAGGSFTGLYNGNEVNRLVFLSANGILKSDFDIGTGPASASVLCLETDDEGSWFVGGSFSVFDGLNQGRLAKISSEGEHDIAYLSSGIGFDNSVFSILPLPDKRIIIGGNFKKFNGESASRITCLLENGSIDFSFNPEKSGANNVVKTTVLQADGKIITGGNFTKYNDVTSNRIVRITPSGEIDYSFNIGDGCNGQVYSLAIQNDQKIVVAGNFTKYNGSALNAGRIIRLLPDGSKDPSFNIGSGADGIVDTVVLQPNGKILVGGHFKTFNGLSFAGLLRLNSDGSIDTGFNVQQGFDKYVFAIAVQSDQKILVGGSFLTFNGISQKRILRLNNDGSLDPTFESGTGFSKGDVRSILLQPDGRILLGGAFSGTYKNVASSRLIRLMPSGGYDNSFSANLNNTLFAMNFTEDYRLLIGGNFNSVSGVSKHRIARLKLCVNTTIWNGISWSNGFPSVGKDVYFKEDYSNLTTTNICGCNIDQGKIVVIPEKNTLEIEFAYTGLGTLVLENSASLYQTDDDMVNTGIIHLKRKTTPVMRYDLTYWSSPVNGQKLFDLSPETLYDKYTWYDPLKGWTINYRGTMIMVPGQGYNIRAPQNYSLKERVIFEGTFKGIPNNGKVELDFETANRYYLVGNPYPSAISADAFLKQNLGKTKGAIYFWTHNQPPSNYEYSNDGFAAYNLLGGIGTRPSLNSGVSNEAPDGNIASGQGFFVVSNVVGTLEFNNSMRVSGNNSTFFKPAKNLKVLSQEQEDKYRFWLNLADNHNGFRQILLGYADEATNYIDLNYDAEFLSSDQGLDFYSITENKKLTIQGRAKPLIESDVIVLGYKAYTKGTFYLEIDHQDSFFDKVTIFLIDKALNKVHNLSELPYQFDSDSGIFNNRFSITYTNTNLGISKEAKELDDTFISVKNQIITIKCLNENIRKVEIYDVSGKQLYKRDKIETDKIDIQNLISSHQVLVVKVFFENSNSISKKLIF
ncbi:T9SS sorting signal type C domain-containing protein [Flavobacterium notoginsengisoli]|uniref:T9SS sorting signal type C domain-containing protein n=1 Tax=Flavobacterium notoginsengisoli TaxID=1478199 RepID=UPI0036D31455